MLLRSAHAFSRAERLAARRLTAFATRAAAAQPKKRARAPAAPESVVYVDAAQLKQRPPVVFTPFDAALLWPAAAAAPPQSEDLPLPAALSRDLPSPHDTEPAAPDEPAEPAAAAQLDDAYTKPAAQQQHSEDAEAVEPQASMTLEQLFTEPAPPAAAQQEQLFTDAAQQDSAPQAQPQKDVLATLAALSHTPLFVERKPPQLPPVATLFFARAAPAPTTADLVYLADVVFTSPRAATVTFSTEFRVEASYSFRVCDDPALLARLNASRDLRVCRARELGASTHLTVFRLFAPFSAIFCVRTDEPMGIMFRSIVTAVLRRTVTHGDSGAEAQFWRDVLRELTAGLFSGARTSHWVMHDRATLTSPILASNQLPTGTTLSTTYVNV